MINDEWWITNFIIYWKSINCKISYSSSAISALEKRDTMGERIGRIRQIGTDFGVSNARISSKKSKKIRSYPPNPLNPFSHCIPKLSCTKYNTFNFALYITYMLKKNPKRPLLWLPVLTYICTQLGKISFLQSWNCYTCLY